MAILRPPSVSDAAALADLGARAFTAKFGHLYDPADLAAFIAKVHSEEAVAAELADDTLIWNVAWDGERPVAFCKLGLRNAYAGWAGTPRPIDLMQMYADPARLGEGLGAQLMDWALAEARGRAATEVLLSVYSDNPQAQRFYARYGFAKIADIDFYVGTHRDDEYLYALRL